MGADVKATDPRGRRWVIQCEHRKDGWSGSAVGAPDLYVLWELLHTVPPPRKPSFSS
ncbi:hypothetical protein ACFVZ4_03295 [Streptomyces goshikiensis]|uniref:hypothetical protein n=1 Tax=Streptomyces goshikiensis TaxID=1942 RepID=UPI0036A7651D